MRRTSILLTLVFTLAAFAVGLTPAAAEDPPIAIPVISGSTVALRLVDEPGVHLLSVRAPNGTQVRRSFQPGEMPTYSIFDDNGQVRRDGIYAWELVAVPTLDPRIIEELEDARDRGDLDVLIEYAERGLLPTPRSQTGSVHVVDGRFLKPVAVEGRAAPAVEPRDGEPSLALRDFVINDDIIGIGSLCVGFDCVNGESFGFDTVRLKENNLRLHFDDTSTLAGFPNRDWRIIANDSASGGLNRFSIEDSTGGRIPFTIEAAAASNSIYVDSTSRVGFRTSTPVLDLHVATSNTPGIRLEQTSAGGFSAQSWDIAGNEANFFVRDVSNGSTLPFRIRPGAPTSTIDISADGRVGVRDATPEDVVDVSVSGANGGLTLRSTSDGILPQLTLVEPTRTWRFRVNNPGDFVFTDATSSESPFRIQGGSTVSDRLVVTTSGISVTGSITQNANVIHPDYVFEPDYALPSIEEHGRQMWENKSLPAVGPGKVNENGEAVIELATHQLSMLEELERAHLYILQLHTRLGELESAFAALKQTAGEQK